MLHRNLTKNRTSETKFLGFSPSFDKNPDDEVATEQLTALVDAVNVTFIPNDNLEISQYYGQSQDALIKDSVIEHK